MVAPARGSGHRGHAMIAALMVLVLVSIAVALLAASLNLHLRSVARENADLQLTALADAALAETLARLSQNPDFPGLTERPFGHGHFSSEVRWRGRRDRSIVVRTRYGKWTREIQAEANLSPTRLRVGGWRRLPP